MPPDRTDQVSDPSLLPYTQPAPGVNSDHPQVVALAHRLTRDLPTPREKAVALFEFVRDSIRYFLCCPCFELEHYLATTILSRGKGFCVQKSSLLVALARACGIPARLVFADIKNHLLPPHLIRLMGRDIMYYHGYVEMYLQGKWVKATPSFDKELCRDKGFKLVEFDGLRDAVLPARDLEGRPHITYLHHHGTRRGVPLQEIMDTWTRIYGQDRVNLWKEMFTWEDGCTPGERM